MLRSAYVWGARRVTSALFGSGELVELLLQLFLVPVYSFFITNFIEILGHQNPLILPKRLHILEYVEEPVDLFVLVVRVPDARLEAASLLCLLFFLP